MSVHDLSTPSFVDNCLVEIIIG